MIPVALLLSISLLVGCGGKKDDKKPSQPESQESSEPEPGPGPEPEPEPGKQGLDFPKALQDNNFINLGVMSYDIPDEHFTEIMANQPGFADLNWSGYSYVDIDYEYDYYYGYHYIETGTTNYQVYNDGISVYDYLEIEEYDYPGLAKYEYQDDKYQYLYILTEDGGYEKDTGFYEGMTSYVWHSLPEEYDPVSSTYGNITQLIYFQSQPAFAKIGDFYYVASYEINKGSYSTDNAYNEDFTYCYTEKKQTILEISSEGKIAHYYCYSEELYDHDMTTGVALEEPQAIYRYLDNIEFYYDDYKDYPNVQQLINDIPEQYVRNAKLSYRTAAANVGDDGKLIAAPEFPSTYALTSSLLFDDYETAFLSFAPYYNNQYYAIDFDKLSITYSVLKGEDAGQENTVTIEVKDDFLEEIATQMGAELQVFNEETYFIVNRDNMDYIDFVFSAFAIQGVGDVTVRQMTNDFILR